MLESDGVALLASKAVMADKVMHAARVQKHLAELKEKGVTVIRQLYTPEQIARFKAAYVPLRDEVFSKIADMEPTRVRAPMHDKQTSQEINAYILDGYPVLVQAEGRIDFIYHMDQGVFASEEFNAPALVSDIMDDILGTKRTHTNGALPSFGGSKDGPWHRDIYPMYEHLGEAFMVSLPTAEVNVVIPLVPTGPENGATEFIIGSHNVSHADSAALPRIQPSLEPGDVIVFDGKILHRGRANVSHSGTDRSVIYQEHTPSWYNASIHDVKSGKIY
jgi:ectoine hydroxylase-related dioxygenase (phytanoyl-CoA dioxygenase family)